MNRGLIRAIGVMIGVRCIRRYLAIKGFDDQSNPFMLLKQAGNGVYISFCGRGTLRRSLSQ